MATSFDDAFGPGFASSLGTDAPDQNFLQSAQPQADTPAPDQSAFQDPAAGTDINASAQSFDPASFGAADPSTAQFGDPNAAHPNGPANFLSHLLGLNPNTVSAMAARIGGGANQAAAAGGSNPGFMGSTPGTPAIPVGSGANPARQKLSLVDTIGRLGDVFANAGGAKAQYQPYLDSRVATLQAQQQAALEQQKTSAGIVKDGVDTQQSANEINHGYASALQAIAARGGDPTIAAGPLAQQLGIPADQAQSVIDNYKSDPKSLDDLVTATSEAAKGGSGPKFANQPLYTRDAAGNIHVNQLSNQGGLQEAALQAGQHVVVPGISEEDLGTTKVTKDKFGNILSTDAVQGKPGEGTAVSGKNADGTPKYVPISVQGQANVTKTNAEITAANDKNNANAAAAAAKAKVISDANAGAQANLANLSAGINKLDKLNAQPSTNQNLVGNILSTLGASKAGQAMTPGTQATQTRQSIQQAAQGLMLNMTAGRGQMFRTNAEQQRALNMINNPTSTTATMRQALGTLRQMVGSLTPTAGPAVSASDAAMLAKYGIK